MTDMTDKENEEMGKQVLTYAGIIVIALIALVMWGCPNYYVWKARVDAQAEVERAKGTAEANRIMGASPTGVVATRLDDGRAN